MLLSGAALAQFDGFVNKGMIGVGRLQPDLLDTTGADTLGGLFSSMAIDTASLEYRDGVISGVLYGLPDRGFGDGGTDYRPRLQTLPFTFTPYFGAAPVAGDQIRFTNSATTLFTYGGTNFTGFDAGDTNTTAFPRSLPGSIGGGRRSLDPEGLVRTSDGGWFVSDEYGPLILKFDAAGALQYSIDVPAALLPKNGAFPGTNSFTATAAPQKGRRNNRGLEGLTLSADGRRLFAMLQSPAIQDSGAGNLGRNTRLLQFDVAEGSATFGQLLTEHVYTLTLNATAQTNRHTPVSEILAVTPTTFLMLERDGLGLGSGTNTAPSYKRIVVASTLGATNIAGSAFDLEAGAPGARSLPAGALPEDVRPMARLDLVDMLDPAQLALFGLNASTNQDANTISEKWEAMALIPLRDAAAPDDFALLVGNDNDFKTSVVIHNGVAVGTNDVPVDNMLLAYRLTLPNYGATNRVATAPEIGFLFPVTPRYASGPLPLRTRVHDADGRVMKVEFFEDGTKIGEAVRFPFDFVRTNPPVGARVYRAVATDNDGLAAEAVLPLEITAGNEPPLVALVAPTNGAAFTAPVVLRLVATASDADGSVASVQFFAGSASLGVVSAPPYELSLTNVPVGDNAFRVVAADNLGARATNGPVTVSVSRATSSSPFTVQILHASDFEAGIPALDDAVGFSSVLNALRSTAPTNTLVLSSGDNYIPGPFFTASADPAAPYNGVKGRADISILNALGIQASAAGNHEFDDNTGQFASMLRADAAVAYPGTQFPYLSANLDWNADSNTRGLIVADGLDWRRGTNRVARSTTITVAGQLVGIVGATTVELRQISSPGAIVVNTNLVASIQAAVDALLAQGVNKVVLLAHLQQYANEFALARSLRDVDLIIAGGSHTVFAKPSDRLREGDVAAENYPVSFVSASGEPVYVVNTGANYRYVGRLIATFDTAGRIVGVDAASGAYATDAAGVAAVGSVPANPAITNIVAGLAGILDAKDGNLFGRTRTYLNGLRQSVRTEETNLGDLTAEANLWRARRLDTNTSLSLKNGGGIRDSIGALASSSGNALPQRVPPLANPRVGKVAGDVSQLDIENSLRFNNALTLVTLTARQLRDAMEWSVSATTATATPGQFPQVGGMWFSFQPTNAAMTYTRGTNNAITGIATPGARLRTLVATRADGTLDLVVEDGVLRGDPDRTFRMVTLDFLANGGDSYYPLTLGTGRLDISGGVSNRTFVTDGTEQKALADYLAAAGSVGPNDTDRPWDLRIQNLAFRADTAAGAQLGDVRFVGNAAEVSFTTLAGKIYRLEFRNGLAGNWTPLDGEVVGDGGVRVLRDADPDPGVRLYRVVAR